ncbi:hypothetical protein M231_07415 [Tremella mesenterica]|uniref:Uncharacterized protein n=1 Tax=Tremella mesenterica TaxID=5217 RepID=A0A4Q1B9D9_TREME|nr:hypothetical protein M231_07415 [Tremella mesenterica]
MDIKKVEFVQQEHCSDERLIPDLKDLTIDDTFPSAEQGASINLRSEASPNVSPADITPVIPEKIRERDRHRAEELLRRVESGLRSEDWGRRGKECADLWEELTRGTKEESRARQQDLLEDLALSYIPPLLNCVPCTTKADPILNIISLISHPKEIILALNEAMLYMQDRVEYQYESHSDSENDDLFGSHPIHSPEDLTIVAEELLAILRCYSLALPRLENKKSTPTLLSLTEAVYPLLDVFSQNPSPTHARLILLGLARLVESAWEWTISTRDVGGEQKDMLFKLLSQAIAQFAPSMESRLTERWFLSSFPKFAREDDQPSPWARQVLNSCLSVYRRMGYDEQILYDQIFRPNSTDSYTHLAALHLLAHLVSSPGPSLDLPSVSPTAPSRHSIKRSEASMVLIESLRTVDVALSGYAVDAGVTWLWYLVHGAVPDGVLEVDLETGMSLLNMLIPLLEEQSGVTSQLARVKLVGAIIASCPKPLDQILLFKHLLDPFNPYQRVRIQSLQLLRDHLSHSTSSSSLHPPLNSSTIPHRFLFPALLDQLGPIIFSTSHFDTPTPGDIPTKYQTMTYRLLHGSEEMNDITPHAETQNPLDVSIQNPHDVHQANAANESADSNDLNGGDDYESNEHYDNTPLTLPLKEMIHSFWPEWYSECLRTFWLLATIDQENLTGIWSLLPRLDHTWMEPMRKTISRLRAELEVIKDSLKDPNVVHRDEKEEETDGVVTYVDQLGMDEWDKEQEEMRKGVNIIEAELILDRWEDVLHRSSLLVDRGRHPE